MFESIKEVRGVSLFLREGNRKVQEYKCFIRNEFFKRCCIDCNYRLEDPTDLWGIEIWFCKIGGFTVEAHGTCEEFIKCSKQSKKQEI